MPVKTVVVGELWLEQKDQSFRYVIDNVFSYNNEWNKLIYSVMLGHSFEKYTYEQFGAKSDNYANGAFPSSSFRSHQCRS